MREEERLDQVKYQLKLQRRSIALTGLLNLSARPISALIDVGTQPRLKVLDISNTPIDSLDTLPPQPFLREIIANGSQIDNFVGFSRHPRLAALSMIGTPISRRPNFRVICLVLVGQRLTSIDGRSTGSGERREAAAYPLVARHLIEAGWELDPELPSITRFRELAGKYRLRFPGVDSEFMNDEASKYFVPPPAFLPGPRYVEMEYEEEEDTEERTLLLQICSELRRIGIKVEPREDQVVRVVRKLGDALKGLDENVDGLLGSTAEEEPEEDIE
jgi:hypothetical protein